MRTLSIYILALIMGLISPDIQAMDTETTAISFDLDGVLSAGIAIPQHDTESRDLTVLRQRHALLNCALNRNPHLQSEFARELRQKDPILTMPVEPIVDLIWQLKRNGYTVVAATNQDHWNHGWYRERLRATHNVDLKNLFHATLTTNIRDDRTDLIECLDCCGVPFCYEWMTKESHLYSVHNADQQVYTLRHDYIQKPKDRYYQALEHLVKRKNPKITKIIHIDDMGNNILGALHNGLDAIHFDVDVLNADAATLAAAITKLKNDLKKLGVQCD